MNLKRIIAWILLVGFVLLLVNILFIGFQLFISGMVYIIIAGIFLLTNKMGGRSHTENPEKEENSKDIT